MSDSTAPPEATDPGFKQRNQKVGANDEFTLPDIVQIISPTHTTWVGRYTQEFWVRLNFLLRGLAGTLVQWFVFFAEIGKAYPAAAALAFASVTLPLEEKYSENPYVGNTIHYAMEVIDPAAAAKIYTPKVFAADPVGDASKKLLDEATKAYLASPEYAQLKIEVEADVQRQIRKSVYLSAGMKTDAAEVDAEIAQAAQERAARRLAVLDELDEPAEEAPAPHEAAQQEQAEQLPSAPLDAVPTP